MTDERAILSFLTENAELSDLITRRQFIGLFPAAKRDDFAIRALYQDLYDTRSSQIRNVQKKINFECSNSSQILREDLARAKNSAAEVEEDENDNIYNEILTSRVYKYYFALSYLLSNL